MHRNCLRLIFSLSVAVTGLSLSSCGFFGGSNQTVTRTTPYYPPQQQYAPAPQRPVNPQMNIPPSRPGSLRASYRAINTQQRVCALTFDDGPHASNTPRLLRILRERNVKATFYVVGKNVKTYPSIIRQIVADGHELGNHTFNHPSLTSLSDAQVRNELRTTATAITNVLPGYRIATLRPPYGATNDRVKQLAFGEFRYPSIMWSIDPQDWKRPGVSVVTSRIVNGIHPGAIILAHDIHAPTIDAMPSTIDQLLAKGYRFVTVSQLLSMDRPAPVATAPATIPAGTLAAAPRID